MEPERRLRTCSQQGPGDLLTKVARLNPLCSAGAKRKAKNPRGVWGTASPERPRSGSDSINYQELSAITYREHSQALYKAFLNYTDTGNEATPEQFVMLCVIGLGKAIPDAFLLAEFPAVRHMCGTPLELQIRHIRMKVPFDFVVASPDGSTHVEKRTYEELSVEDCAQLFTGPDKVSKLAASLHNEMKGGGGNQGDPPVADRVGKLIQILDGAFEPIQEAARKIANLVQSHGKQRAFEDLKQQWPTATPEMLNLFLQLGTGEAKLTSDVKARLADLLFPSRNFPD